MATELTMGGEAVVVPAAEAAVEVPGEHLKYATFLQYTVWTGIAGLIVTFFMYLGGALPTLVKPSLMPRYWGMRAGKYMAVVHAQAGWHWLGQLGYGDYFALLGIAFLALLTIAGYLFILLPSYVGKKDKIYAVLVVVEAIVLMLAASGILASGTA